MGSLNQVKGTLDGCTHEFDGVLVGYKAIDWGFSVRLDGQRAEQVKGFQILKAARVPS